MFGVSLTDVLLVLILFTGYKVIQIILEIRRGSKCPEDRDLKNAVLGLAERRGADHENIISHLGVCETCRDKVSEFNQRSN